MNIPVQFASYTYPPVSILPHAPIQITRLRRRIGPFTPIPLSGLGAGTVMGDAASIASAGATVTTGILAALHAVAIGSSAAGPIGLAITGAITLAATLYEVFKGCGQTCIQATEYVNQAEPILLQNLQNYLAAPVHYASLQAAALNNFNTAWNAVLAACGQASLGQAGVNCISARQAGACVSKNATPGGWVQDSSGNWSYQFATGPNSGSNCWNWFIAYHDPIANDPTVVPDPVAGGDQTSVGVTSASGTGNGVDAGGTGNSAGASGGGAQGGLPIPLILAGGIALLVAMGMD